MDTCLVFVWRTNMKYWVQVKCFSSFCWKSSELGIIQKPSIYWTVNIELCNIQYTELIHRKYVNFNLHVARNVDYNSSIFVQCYQIVVVYILEVFHWLCLLSCIFTSFTSWLSSEISSAQIFPLVSFYLIACVPNL